MTTEFRSAVGSTNLCRRCLHKSPIGDSFPHCTEKVQFDVLGQNLSQKGIFAMLQLQYKDGKFHALGAYFTLPEGFFLSADDEFAFECALSTFSPDETTQYTWYFNRECNEGPDDGLMSLLDEDLGHTPLSELHPILLNGLSGFGLYYAAEFSQYFEARFPLPGGEQLCFIVEVPHGDILKVKETDHFKAAFTGMGLDEC